MAVYLGVLLHVAWVKSSDLGKACKVEWWI